jgi:hypothetical protein
MLMYSTFLTVRIEDYPVARTPPLGLVTSKTPQINS